MPSLLPCVANLPLRQRSLPLVAPLGTVVTIWVDVSLTTVAAVPLNETLGLKLRFCPLIVTLVPTGPEVGEKLSIWGGA